MNGEHRTKSAPGVEDGWRWVRYPQKGKVRPEVEMCGPRIYTGCMKADRGAGHRVSLVTPFTVCVHQTAPDSAQLTQGTFSLNVKPHIYLGKSGMINLQEILRQLPSHVWCPGGLGRLGQGVLMGEGDTSLQIQWQAAWHSGTLLTP